MSEDEMHLPTWLRITRLIGRWLVLVAVVIVGLALLIVLIFSVLPIEALFDAAYHLLAGWFLFIRKVLPTVQLNVGLILSSLAALGVAMWALHLVIKGIRLKTSNPFSWSMRHTLAITTLTLVLFGAAIAGTGVGHQIAWMKNEPFMNDGFRVVHSMRMCGKALQLAIRAKKWAGDHEGHYPSALQELVPDWIESQEDFTRLYYWSSTPSGELEPLIYLGERLTDSDSGELPLLVSPRPFVSGKYLVCRNDGSVGPETLENYEKAMSAWRAHLAKLPPPK